MVLFPDLTNKVEKSLLVKNDAKKVRGYFIPYSALTSILVDLMLVKLEKGF